MSDGMLMVDANVSATFRRFGLGVERDPDGYWLQVLADPDVIFGPYGPGDLLEFLLDAGMSDEEGLPPCERPNAHAEGMCPCVSPDYV